MAWYMIKRVVPTISHPNHCLIYLTSLLDKSKWLLSILRNHKGCQDWLTKKIIRIKECFNNSWKDLGFYRTLNVLLHTTSTNLKRTLQRVTEWQLARILVLPCISSWDLTHSLPVPIVFQSKASMVQKNCMACKPLDEKHLLVNGSKTCALKRRRYCWGKLSLPFLQSNLAFS